MELFLQLKKNRYQIGEAIDVTVQGWTKNAWNRLRELGPKDRGKQGRGITQPRSRFFNISVQARVEGGKSDIDKITAILVQGSNSMDNVSFRRFMAPFLGPFLVFLGWQFGHFCNSYYTCSFQILKVY